jgi:hypothetical protein
MVPVTSVPSTFKTDVVATFVPTPCPVCHALVLAVADIEPDDPPNIFHCVVAPALRIVGLFASSIKLPALAVPLRPTTLKDAIPVAIVNVLAVLRFIKDVVT